MARKERFQLDPSVSDFDLGTGELVWHIWEESWTTLGIKVQLGLLLQDKMISFSTIKRWQSGKTDCKRNELQNEKTTKPMNFESSPWLLAPLTFVKEFCHSTDFCFASKPTDTDHKQENKWIFEYVVGKWGQWQLYNVIAFVNTHKPTLRITAHVEIQQLLSEKWKNTLFTSKLNIRYDGSERTEQYKHQPSLPSARIATAVQNAVCNSLLQQHRGKALSSTNQLTKGKNRKFLENKQLSRSREHVPGSSSTSLMYFSRGLAFLTDPEHDDCNNTITT